MMTGTSHSDMTIPEVEKALKTLTILVDTREQPTGASQRRLDSLGYPYRKQKLDYGDYSAVITLDGEEIPLTKTIAIERKMSLDEISSNLTAHRDRFLREFERAEVEKCKMYVLVEGGSWDKIKRHDYNSKFNTKAFEASLLMLMARYNMPIIFVPSIYSGQMIGQIIYREAKEYLLKLER